MRYRTIARKWYVRPFVYIGVFLIVLYGSHFAADLLIPYETTEEHMAMASNYLVAQNLPTPHEPFHADGCTLFPDALPWHDFEAACLEHDIAYWAGGPDELQAETNQNFKNNLSDSGPLGNIFGVLMYVGVVYFGDNGISRVIDSHWGFGWD